MISYQHNSINNLKPSGHVDGSGKCKLLLPTPQMIADESTSLYGISPVNSSHSNTPKDQTSTFSEQGSFLITSGAIQATVPANVIFALLSLNSLQVPKSEIFRISFVATKTLEERKYKKA